MTRPQTEFLFAQNVPWGSAAPLPDRPGVSAKTLSEDDASGERTVIVRLPANYTATVASPFFEEMYVLSGALTLDGAPVKRDGYASIDRGRRTAWGSTDGADVLLWLDNDPLKQPSDLVIHDVLTLPWRGPMIPVEGAAPDLRRKVLRVDPHTGQYRNFLLVGLPLRYPHDWKERDLTHPCVEETFVLAGEITGPQGRIGKGGYFWRPAEVPHGPFCSREGSLAIFRFVKGHHINVWGDEYFPTSYDQPYKPILPPHQQQYGRSAYEGPLAY